MKWICVRQNFTFNHLFEIGDVVESEKALNHHFILLEGIEEHFPPTGRRFVVENNQIVGIYDAYLYFQCGYLV
jgi:hypothetical protein